MANYMRVCFREGEAGDILVEVDAAEDLPGAGEQNAGLRQRPRPKPA
jgi:hypothetical protein